MCCSENVDPTDELKIIIRDALTIGQGHFFGEVAVPIQSITKNAELEQWYTILPSKSTTHKVMFFFLKKKKTKIKVILKERKINKF